MWGIVTQAVGLPRNISQYHCNAARLLQPQSKNEWPSTPRHRNVSRGCRGHLVSLRPSPLTSDLDSLFSSIHSHSEYLCQVSLETQHYTVTNYTEIFAFSLETNVIELKIYHSVQNDLNSRAIRPTFSVIWSTVTKLLINQSINLFVQKRNRHWTGHYGRMQPPLTGARKTMLVKATDDNS